MTVEVLISIDPNELSPRRSEQRPGLNLALVLDRSGSMEGEKLRLTQEAACQAIDALKPGDYVALVTFHSHVECCYSGNLTDPAELRRKIGEITADGGTNLHGGWLQGAKELSRARHPSRLSRIVLLTDGEANEGVLDPDRICSAVSAQASSGIQTTTLGFGGNYNERLLSRMASSGQGNHGYIEDSQHLSAFFEEELAGLLRTRGTAVRLRLQPAPGVQVEWFNPPNLDRENRVCLADLIEDQPLAVVVKLHVPPDCRGEGLLGAELQWHDLESQQLRTVTCRLALPTVSALEWERMPAHPEVESQVARAEAELRRRSAMALLEMQQEDVALQVLGWARELPFLPAEEVQAVDDLVKTVQRGDYKASFKKAAMYSHGHGHGHAQVSRHYLSESHPLLQRQPQGNALRLPVGDGDILHRRLLDSAPWPRLEGMLRGHFYGERLVRGNRSPLGEGAMLTWSTLQSVLEGPFSLGGLVVRMYETPLLHPTTSQQKFRRRLEQRNFTVLELGSPSAGCAALRRMCPFLVSGHEHAFLQATLATVLTHRDNLAITCSLGYLGLLWELLRQPLAPAPEFYLDTFLQAITGLEQGTPYECRSGAFKGWEGTLKDFLPLAIGSARQQSLSLEEAMRMWGSGPYLLEVVPTLLYTLELHGDDPARALGLVTSRAMEADTLGMLVGAALGAVHGTQPGWFLHEELEKFLERIVRARAA